MSGDKIRTLRRKRGLSQEQLGAMISFSQSKISKIENGDWDSLSDLRLIAKALGVKLKDLMMSRMAVVPMKRKMLLWMSDVEMKDGVCHGTRKMRIPCPREKTVS